MAHETGQLDVKPGGDRTIDLRVAAKVENLAVLRSLVAAVATFEDLDFDAVADLRLAVDEACTQLVRAALTDATLVVRIDPRDDALVIQASTTSERPDESIISPGSFSWHVLSSLADEVSTFTGGQQDGVGRAFGISLTARRASLSQ